MPDDPYSSLQIEEEENCDFVISKINQIVDESWSNIQDFDELDLSLTVTDEPNLSEANKWETNNKKSKGYTKCSPLLTPGGGLNRKKTKGLYLKFSSAHGSCSPFSH